MKRALLAIVLAAAAGSARAVDVPRDKQVAVLVRAMSFDRGLKARAGATVDVLIIHARNDPSSAEMGRTIAAALAKLAGVAIQGAPLVSHSVGIAGEAELINALTSRDVDAIYLCRGLETLVAALRRETAVRGVLSIGSSVADVEAGLSLGLDTSGDKPALVVNLAQARAEHVDFASEMLKLARVIR